jgi:hypothetical protein
MEGIPFADLAAFTVTNCGSACSAPSPTPTASPVLDYVYYTILRCSDYSSHYSQAYLNGTFDSGDRVEGNPGVYYVITGYVVSTPVTQTYVYSTGQFGCP